MNFKEIKTGDLQNINPFNRIGKNWMLITSGTKENFNTMTASWGLLGTLWAKDVTAVFVRPQRYTFEFLEKNDYYTLSFFNSDYKKELTYCGSHSGKEVDKIQETGLTPVFNEDFVYFKESNLVLACKKMHTQFVDPKCFIDSSIKNNYENNDYHKVYVGEILKCMVKE